MTAGMDFARACAGMQLFASTEPCGLVVVQMCRICKAARKFGKNTVLEGVRPEFSCCLYSSLMLSWKSRVPLGYLGVGLNRSLLYALRICSICTVHP